MLKKALLSICLVAAFTACKNEKSFDEEDEKKETSAKFDSILANYYEDGLKLNPISATTSGDMRYNDQFPDFLSQEYTDSLRNYYSRYRVLANQVDEDHLSETERMSRDILLWECNINLDGLEYNKEKYLPIDQMWSANLFMGQLASGVSSQPFKTVEDANRALEEIKQQHNG